MLEGHALFRERSSHVRVTVRRITSTHNDFFSEDSAVDRVEGGNVSALRNPNIRMGQYELSVGTIECGTVRACAQGHDECHVRGQRR
jgi:hypothetical protein